jgi:putative Holliday junction resolvase
MRHLGIDFGTKRVGIALSDEGGVMAFPHAVWPRDAGLLTAVTALIARERVGHVVIGHSLDRANVPNAIQTDIESFMLDLTLACGVPISLQPEQYTTQAAKRLQGKHDKIDAAAAALILDAYLQTHR